MMALGGRVAHGWRGPTCSCALWHTTCTCITSTGTDAATTRSSLVGGADQKRNAVVGLASAGTSVLQFTFGVYLSAIGAGTVVRDTLVRCAFFGLNGSATMGARIVGDESRPRRGRPPIRHPRRSTRPALPPGLGGRPGHPPLRPT